MCQVRGRRVRHPDGAKIHQTLGRHLALPVTPRAITATAQISGNAFRIKHFNINIAGSFKIPTPPSVLATGIDEASLAGYPDLEQILQLGSSDNIACLIIEPVMGNGGNIVIPQAFYRALREFCHKNGIVIIADEVQTGFGRTGTFFASNGYAKELDPDIIVFAKGPAESAFPRPVY